MGQAGVTVLDATWLSLYDGSMNSEHECWGTIGFMGKFRLERYPILLWSCAYLLALAVMNGFVVSDVRREAVCIDGPEGRPCLGTVWTPRVPRAVIVFGHGVTANQGLMAAAANAFVRNGYVAVTIDFWGHGRSRERFDWSSNAAQVKAWCDWARARFQGLPLAYLGHSMGGEAGDRAFRDKPRVEAFVSMGMLPKQVPACKTLIAMGRFEELFSAEQASRLANDKAEVLVSPYSDHTLEPDDPVLVAGIVTWVNGALGFDPQSTFPWVRWALMLLATIIGCAAALRLAEQATSFLHRSAPPCDTVTAARPGRLNPFRIAGWALGCKGNAVPPRSGSFLSAAIRGIVFGAVFVVLLSWLLTTNIYTCGLNHPERCLIWLVLTLVITLISCLTVRALERIPLSTTFQRFAVGALTRATPLLVACLVLELVGPGIAFAGMMLGILALVFVFISAIHALATRGARDYRSGAVACGIVLAWIIAFWFPLVWP